MKAGRRETQEEENICTHADSCCCTAETITQHGNTTIFQLKKKNRDFPGGPVAKTSYSQSRESGFDAWSWN